MALGLAIINVQTHQVEEDACTYVVGLRSQSWRCPMTTDIKTDWFASIATWDLISSHPNPFPHWLAGWLVVSGSKWFKSIRLIIVFICPFERAKSISWVRPSTTNFPYQDVSISHTIVVARPANNNSWRWWFIRLTQARSVRLSIR